jgi:hypothetical protein
MTSVETYTYVSSTDNEQIIQNNLLMRLPIKGGK